jgi:NAD-dependent SIR2 family protein deacetylase
LKYRQHGYQDRSDDKRGESGGHSGGKSGSPSPKRDNTFGPRPVNLPGTRTVSRCTQCGTVLPSDPGDKCPKCGFELHSCKQCIHFDPGARFECTQPIPERIAKKDARNDCTFYEIRVTREKETSTPASQRPSTARQAFDNLFKK